MSDADLAAAHAASIAYHNPGAAVGSILRSDLGSIKVAAIGDSFVKLMLGGFNSGGGEALYRLNYGFGFGWTQFLLGHPFIHNNRAIAGDTTDEDGKDGHNLGVSGDTLDEIRQRLSSLTALSGVKYVIVYGGTNDANGLETLANMQADYREIAKTVFNMGAVLEMNTVTGRPLAGWSGANDTERAQRRTRLLEFNDWLRTEYFKELSNEGKPVILLDNFYQFTGSTLSDNADGAFVTSDDVHPSTKGAFIMGAARAAQLAAYVAKDLTRHWVQEQYNASTAPYGNLLNDYEFSGTSGDVTDAEVSGDLATGYTAGNITSTHATAVFSIETSSPVDEGADDWQKMVITSDGAGTVESIRIHSALFGSASPESAAGEYYQAQVQLYMEPSSADDIITEVSLRINAYDDSAAYDVIDMNGTGNPLPNGTLSGLLLTPALQVQTNADRFRFEIYIDVDTSIAGSRTLYFGRPNLRRLETAPDYN